ncbi:type II toxin-antitoxin system HigB family toxin [Brenneria tiliae]|uniref:Type II toxin-antitoxin system HigB family toxin n=1 Tax=Brenneria tiliae TaxID=2914984 RepID=A0ABT0MU03_9GAMM|nr:type II toxin-antitoxin system HigB family toxin [Brenneria tiliae]MCL2893309.1 type II toxin-antitoxin system HigB family toxin [Brenneria tiliae]
MHLISMKTIVEASRRFPQYAEDLMKLGRVIEKGNFPTPDELKKVYPSLDNFKYLDKHYVINVAGNELRVIALIFFAGQKFYVREVMTHAEYDRYTALRRGKKK